MTSVRIVGRAAQPSAHTEICAIAEPGALLLDILRRAGVGVYAPCAGRGVCGRCKVSATGGLSAPTDAERELLTEAELAGGVRLACQAAIAGDSEVIIGAAGPDIERSAFVLLHGDPALAEGGANAAPSADARTAFEPRVTMRDVLIDLEKPAASDWERVASAFNAGQGVLPLIRRAAQAFSGTGSTGALRLHGVSVDGQLIDVAETAAAGAACTSAACTSACTSAVRASAYGIALDIGTTTLVAYLIDLSSGHIVGATGTLNPQSRHGADLISRIAYSESPGGLAELRSEAVDAIDSLIARLASQAGVSSKQIYLTGAVGNTCMHHLFLGIAPGRLARLPYAPAAIDCGLMSPLDVGVHSVNPLGRFFFLPNIAGFVGSDALAAAVAAGVHEHSRPMLLIDIGTNGEILLAANGRVLACSTAAGPAFEGVSISCGMIASDGAIDWAGLRKPRTSDRHLPHLQTDAGIELHVIGGGEPIGVCGSGLVSLVAALREAGLILGNGAYAQGAGDKRLVDGPGGARFILKLAKESTPEVALTQRDVRELQLAKGAIRAGAEILLAQAGIGAGDLERVVLAGAFGTYLDNRAAVAIGLLPAAQRARIESIGNAAGEGAALAVANSVFYREALRLARVIEHIELSADPRFMEVFTDCMTFEAQSHVPL
ncbi:MAG: ASKHA domain-containing protein [Clostridia bacterium]|nr:ASKHA domain-containing protein [Clostridia bacterium]